MKPKKCAEHFYGQCHGAHGDEYISGCKGYDTKCVMYKAKKIRQHANAK